jgi:chromosome segregation ATPase
MPIGTNVNFDLTISLGHIITFSTILVGAMAARFGVKHRIERLAEIISDKAVISDVKVIQSDVAELERHRIAIWNRYNEHEKEASDQREKFNIQIAQLQGELKGIRETSLAQFNSINEHLKRLEDKLDRMSEQRGG